MGSEEEFFAQLLETFKVEAKEHLKTLTDGLLALEKPLSKEQKHSLIESIFREAHSLKGAARSVNLQQIQTICQTLENVLSLWKQNRIEVSSSSFDILHHAIKTIDGAISGTADINQINQTIEELNTLCSISEEQTLPPSSQEQNKEKSIQAVESPKSSKPSKRNPSSTSIEQIKQADHKQKEEQKPSMGSQLPNQQQSEKTIRVSLSKMNRLFQEVEETLMIKLFFKQQLSEIKQLQSDLYIREKNLTNLLEITQMLRQSFQTDSSITNGKELSKKTLSLLDQQLREMKTTLEQFNKLMRNAEQNSHIIGTTVDTLIEDLKKLVMQPMNTLFDTLPPMIREISRDLAKDIDVEFNGGNIEVDRRVIEEIKDPVIHLIRNAIDHGIEKPEEREKLNKPRKGMIRVFAAENEGNTIKLTVSDDGKGMDFNKIKQIALKKGFVTQKQFDEMSDKEAMMLAFHSDISTSQIITELSGRGLGLGIVAEKVEKLGGQVEIESTLGRGTTFILTLPLTLATFRGVHITVEGEEFIIPSHPIIRVLRIHEKNIQRIEGRETIVVDNRSFSFIHLADLLGIPRSDVESNTRKYISVLIIKTSDNMMAFGADCIHSEQEILVKSLSKQNMRVKNIMAATVLETGRVIPILNPKDLIKSAIIGEKTTTRTSTGVQTEERKKSILVAEDSITTRLLLTNILSSASYDVKSAVDGVEALEMIQTQPFDMLITDVEMPRMSGFALTEKVRAMDQFKDVPIIICTALGSKEDRERGIELGANAYLDKSSFNQQSFVSIVKKLI